MATNRILATILRQGGGRLLNTAIAKALPDEPAEAAGRKKNLLAGVAGFVALRVATKSVPGAIVVGSGLIAKKLYDRRQATKAAKSGTAAKTAKDTPAT
ncbi:hypothetical protein [Novosphingobium arvoryzae]|uniref:Uncharacterized protein n=1 Tax=Novosphingobium arvoryzae TaxID=1256514 RepID=A0A918VJR7_9SPHN|nr:hypothetical protein [Novosphingobium arvoryzae]GHA03137.1 hypothetical protein GCM10011617_25120 [Novosphingobium arvoryzae]